MFKTRISDGLFVYINGGFGHFGLQNLRIMVGHQNARDIDKIFINISQLDFYYYQILFRSR